MILTVKRQRQLEQICALSGLSETALMENAGNAAGDFVFAKLKEGRSVAVVCGNGGNGGDGIVCAMKLASLGAQVAIILCGKTPQGNAAVFYKAALRLAIPVIDYIAEQKQALQAIASADIVVDAIYGVGFTGVLPLELSGLFDAINAKSGCTVSLDIPSGVFADNGHADAKAVRAAYTLSFIAKKPAHILKNSARYCGQVEVASIGVTRKSYAQIKDAYYEITGKMCSELLPEREPAAHKGNFGRLMCVVGSNEYRGAAVLCARGAVRCGAGIVEVASCAQALDAVAAQLSEPILHDIFSNDIAVFVDELSRASAIVLGCGLSESEETQQLVKLTLLGAKAPIILDAAGIRALSGSIQMLQETSAPLVLTPHLGEFAALTGISVQKLADDRFEAARAWACANKCVLVLKSESTVVAGPKGELFVVAQGNPGLAKGGSGDLLAGMIGAFCAMGIAPLYASALACYVHANAADLAAHDIDEYALTATDVSGYISGALRGLRE